MRCQYPSLVIVESYMRQSSYLESNLDEVFVLGVQVE
jgi:hypothetical protein